MLFQWLVLKHHKILYHNYKKWFYCISWSNLIFNTFFNRIYKLLRRCKSTLKHCTSYMYIKSLGITASRFFLNLKIESLSSKCYSIKPAKYFLFSFRHHLQDILQVLLFRYFSFINDSLKAINSLLSLSILIALLISCKASCFLPNIEYNFARSKSNSLL